MIRRTQSMNGQKAVGCSSFKAFFCGGHPRTFQLFLKSFFGGCALLESIQFKKFLWCLNGLFLARPWVKSVFVWEVHQLPRCRADFIPLSRSRAVVGSVSRSHALKVSMCFMWFSYFQTVHGVKVLRSYLAPVHFLHYFNAPSIKPEKWVAGLRFSLRLVYPLITPYMVALTPCGGVCTYYQ